MNEIPEGIWFGMPIVTVLSLPEDIMILYFDKNNYIVVKNIGGDIEV